MSIQHRFRKFLPVVVDVETGGFNCETDALLEICVIILRMHDNGNLYIHKTIDKKIKPFEGSNIEADALKFLGIDPFDPLRGAENEKTALDEIRYAVKKEVEAEKCTRAILVGHNAHFDLGFLQKAFERNKLKTPFHQFSTLDTVSLGGLAYGHTVLSTLCEKAGLDWDHKAAHSAVYDTTQTAKLFCQIVNTHPSL